MQPIAEMELMWQCACGKRSFNHHANCDECGKARPAPPPEKEPGNTAREETMQGFTLETRWTEAEMRAWYRAAEFGTIMPLPVDILGQYALRRKSPASRTPSLLRQVRD